MIHVNIHNTLSTQNIDITTLHFHNTENGHSGANFNFSTRVERLVLGRFDEDISIDTSSELIVIYLVPMSYFSMDYLKMHYLNFHNFDHSR